MRCEELRSGQSAEAYIGQQTQEQPDNCWLSELRGTATVEKASQGAADFDWSTCHTWADRVGLARDIVDAVGVDGSVGRGV